MEVKKFRILKDKASKKYSVEELVFFSIIWTLHKSDFSSYEEAVSYLDKLDSPYLIV